MILGVDFGLKRIGLAIADEKDSFSVALTTVENDRLMAEIIKVIEDKRVSKIVMGYPLNGSGQEGFIALMTKTFMGKLQEKFPDIEFILIDESMSTKIAIQHLRSLGYSAKSIEEKKDAEAARVILDAYLKS